MSQPPQSVAISPTDEDRPPAPLSVMALYRPQIAGAHQEVVHLALGDGVADLHGRGRGALVQLLGGEGRAVDAVLADAPAGHDDAVAGQGLFFVAGASGDLGRHGADRAAEDQGLAQEAFVKDDGPVDRGDAGLVAAVLHALAHAFEDPARVQQARRQLASWKGEAKQKTLVLQSRFAPMPVPMGSRFTPTMPVRAPP
jgi:hypothetical protein